MTIARPELAWPKGAAVVIASGPSLSWDDYADVELVRQSGLRTIAVNSSWKVAPFCSVIYAGDTAWWRHNHHEINVPAARWTCARNAMGLYGCNYRARYIKPGYNSGANAIELAANVFKADPIILLGFDGSVRYGVHHHGKHKHTPNPTPERAKRWQDQFECLKKRIGKTQVYNCSRYTELKQFKCLPLAEALERLKR